MDLFSAFTNPWGLAATAAQGAFQATMQQGQPGTPQQGPKAAPAPAVAPAAPRPRTPRARDAAPGNKKSTFADTAKTIAAYVGVGSLAAVAGILIYRKVKK